MSKTSQTANTKYFARFLCRWDKNCGTKVKLYTPPIEQANFLLFYYVHELMSRCIKKFLLGYDERKKCHPIGGCIKIREISMLYYIITYKHCFFDFISFLRERTYKKKRNVIIFLHKVQTMYFCPASILSIYKHLRGKGLRVARRSSKKFHNDRLYTRCVEGFALILNRFGKLLMFKELQAKFFSKLFLKNFIQGAQTQCAIGALSRFFRQFFPTRILG